MSVVFVALFYNPFHIIVIFIVLCCSILCLNKKNKIKKGSLVRRVVGPKYDRWSENIIVGPKIWSLLQKWSLVRKYNRWSKGSFVRKYHRWYENMIVGPKKYCWSENTIVGPKVWLLVRKYDRWNENMIVGLEKYNLSEKKTISWGTAVISYEPFDNVKPKLDVHNQVCPFCPEHVEDELQFIVISETFKIQGCTNLPRANKNHS